ncbi:type I polyketide synthase [Streptomyces sp. NRRL S-920]|uniref:type I polyketide synthase n=1 Tax=Streptomyces sp. NRRL S-920 TaxID=1463921 RepID=UPI0009966E45|nr:type I polyketide synthase [Streptomyces sp. NRRL S-920]
MRSTAADIAVVGMACRFPGVRNLEEFWRLLLDGKSTVGVFPEQRAVDVRPPSHPDAATVNAGSFFDSVDLFDADFFGIPPAEAVAMDPVQRLGLELAWEAVEDARVPAAALAGRGVDVMVAGAPSGYELLRKLSGSDRDDHYSALGSSGALIANRISHLFDIRGMSFCADSGQSSSLVALALACDRIRSGAVDMAIAGGVHLIADPESGLGLANLGVLSPDGRCFTFDERANGFVRGEGGAFVVLKRRDLAVADHDRIHALVRGWGIGSGGAAFRMPDPSPEAQAATVLAALESTDVPFDGVEYVEAHGTGTRRGDPAELSGLRTVSRRTGRSRPLVVGSVKTNVGHLEPAAGIVGLVKAALCVAHGRLVPSLNHRTPHPSVPDFHEDFEVPRAARPWSSTPGRPRRAGVSSFGMGGTYAHVILEQAPEEQAAPGAAHGRGAAAGAGVLPWVLSARSAPALREQAARLRDHLTAHTALSAADVGHSLLTTRTHFAHRAVVLGDGRAESLAALDALAAGGEAARSVRGTVAEHTGPVVFVFPGQGSQWVGMGRQLYAQSEGFAQRIDECARALAPWTDWSLIDVVTGAEPAASLDRVDVVQPALFAVMVSLAQVWRSLGVVPDAVVGHSQGEIAAACVSGGLTLQDAAKIVALRSRALTELTGLGGGMSAVSASADWVRDRLPRWSGRLSTAAVNGPGSVVISGDGAALDEFAAMAAGEGVRVRRVKVDYASHSRHVERVRERLLDAVADIAPRSSSVAFHSTVTGAPLDTRALDASYWYENLSRTVLFGTVVEDLMRGGGVFVEVGPHPVLEVAVAQTADSLAVSPPVVGTLHKGDGGLRDVLLSAAELHVRGVPVDWQPLFTAHQPRSIGLPTYAFQRQRYWLTEPDTDGTATAATGLDSERAVLSLVSAEAAAVLSRSADLPDRGVRPDPDVSFKDLGLDSSMAVRLRNRLAAAVGMRLPATVAFSHPTVRKLSRHLFSLLAPEPADPQALPQTPTQSGAEGHSDDELFELIDRGYA